MSILFVVESPAKIKKISSFLGKNYNVKASVGHFRDLDEKTMSIDFENNFEPIYVIHKQDVVRNLKAAMKTADEVYLATDDDNEGCAIAQHILDVLKPKKYKRVVFRAITKKAVLEGIKNAGPINKNQVNAQKTRRVLDRLYGYMISPELRKQLGGCSGGKLSAGRVQSVATRIIIDRENEIKKFIDNNEGNANSTFFKTSGQFSGLKASLYELNKKSKEDDEILKGELSKITLSGEDDPYNNITTFLKNCTKSSFKVHSIHKKKTTRSPAPPFTTSTLQQEANRKLGMTVDNTMKNAQKLYEAGYITYMRTDSVEISEEGHEDIKNVIIDKYGKEYYQKNIYKNKNKNAQEAHEAIRPTHCDLIKIDEEIDDECQIKLYKLIWKRTIASQMKPAEIDVTIIQITISKYKGITPFYYFQSQIEKITFEGFMKVYIESLDDPKERDEEIMDENDENLNLKIKIPKISSKLDMNEIISKQEYLRPPCRYSEASMVKKLEEVKIGRPSTFVNTIKTIKSREYVRIGDIPGVKKDIMTFSINCDSDKISKKKGSVVIGKDNKKLIPTDLGITVNDFLMKNFPEMMEYDFTANIEKEMDKIALGEKVWHKVVKRFYDQLKPKIEELSKNYPKDGGFLGNDRLLGTDSDGNEIYVGKTKYGPVVKKKVGDKIVYENLDKNVKLNKLKLSDTKKMFQYPKKIGKYHKKNIMMNKGIYGFYLTYDDKKYSIGVGIDPETIDSDKAIQIIKEKKSSVVKEYNIKIDRTVSKVLVIDGKYGPYLMVTKKNKKLNFPIPRGYDISKITESEIEKIISTKKIYSGSKTDKSTNQKNKKVKKSRNSKK